MQRNCGLGYHGKADSKRQIGTLQSPCWTQWQCRTGPRTSQSHPRTPHSKWPGTRCTAWIAFRGVVGWGVGRGETRTFVEVLHVLHGLKKVVQSFWGRSVFAKKSKEQKKTQKPTCDSASNPGSNTAPTTQARRHVDPMLLRNPTVRIPSFPTPRVDQALCSKPYSLPAKGQKNLCHKHGPLAWFCRGKDSTVWLGHIETPLLATQTIMNIAQDLQDPGCGSLACRRNLDSQGHFATETWCST